MIVYGQTNRLTVAVDQSVFLTGPMVGRERTPHLIDFIDVDSQIAILVYKYTI